MDGVTFLATNVVSSGSLIGGIFIIIVGILLSSIIITFAILEEEPFGLLFLFFPILIIVSGIKLVNDDKPVTQYFVTISENVSMKSFNEKYTVVSQNDQLYTIEEKESE